MRPMLTLLVILLSFTVAIPSFGTQVLEHDTQHGFTVSRPASWFLQERPTAFTRVMLGIEGDGYVGNCNVTVVHSQSTVAMTQAAVDEGENKRALTAAFFLTELRELGTDVKILNVKQVKRGAHYGHLVNYTYSYLSPSLNARLYIRAELFSHSRPGNVYSFTCNTGALSLPEAQRAFQKEEKAYELLSSSLQVKGDSSSKYSLPALPNFIQISLGVAVSIFLAVAFLTITLGLNLDKDDRLIRNWRILIFLITLTPTFVFFYKIGLPIILAILCGVAVSALVAPLLAFFPLSLRRKGLSRFK